ncbi:MAG: prephenate dehydrogenase [Halodesulfurarchaeum sp.]
MDALVVGAGAIGRWFAEMIPWKVTFADVDESAAVSSARSLGERGSVGELRGESRYDVVVIAVPMRVASETIRVEGKRAERAIVDLTGSMQEPLSAMEVVASGIERVSYHPLFAPEHAPGNIAVSVGESGPITDKIWDGLETNGNELIEVDPAEHDEAMKTIQGRAHAAILAFGLTASDVPPGLSTPVYEQLHELLERVTSGTPQVYADIQDRFDGAQDVRDAASKLASADREAFETLYRDAR